jgi:Domain of unknown function (DUF4395)
MQNPPVHRTSNFSWQQEETMRESQLCFIRQQGFSTPPSSNHLYSALMFQPRVIGGLVALGIVSESSWLFLALSAVLWWNAIVPTHNVFDGIYNYAIADSRGLPRLGAAPAPRRFAQGMAGTFALAIAVALLLGATTAAWLGESLFSVALMLLIFGRFCVGSYVFHVLQQRLSTKRQSLPTHAGQCG